jgi:hypothetical protein
VLMRWKKCQSHLWHARTSTTPRGALRSLYLYMNISSIYFALMNISKTALAKPAWCSCVCTIVQIAYSYVDEFVFLNCRKELDMGAHWRM